MAVKKQSKTKYPLKNEKVFKTDDEYYADKEYISNSMISDFLYCEYLYQVKHVDQTFEPLKEPIYFIYGRAVDTLLTEEESEFGKRFFPIDRRVDTDKLPMLKESLAELKKEIQDKKAEKKATTMLEKRYAKMEEDIKTLEDVDGKTQITMTDYKHIMETAKELQRQPLYQMFGMREKGTAQEDIVLTIDGHKRKGKLDYLNVEKRIIADVKTTANLIRFDPRDYIEQMSNYRELVSVKYGIPEEEWDVYLLVGDKNTDFKRSEIFLLDKNLMNAAKPERQAVLQLMAERIKTGFYNPVTANQAYWMARREKCMFCDHYRNCQFSLQKEITLIS